MQFRTEIKVGHAPFTITHRDDLVLMGSCFSESIGTILQRYRFGTTINSHGVIFNPESVAQALDDVIDRKVFAAPDLVQHAGVFFSYSHHGRFKSESADELLSVINNNISTAHLALSRAKVLLITFGSSWAYQLKMDGRIVANCHKQPQQYFEKVLLDHTLVEERWLPLLQKLRAFNPHLEIVFTVSPVRHWKDGPTNNQVSKAHLSIATRNFTDRFSGIHYFPAYEIVMDDLRDYRFYKEDMLHPSEVAVDYIWQKFRSWCIAPATNSLLDELEPLIRFTEHRPLHMSGDAFAVVLAEKEHQISEKIASTLK